MTSTPFSLTHPQVINAMETLKKKSDVLCPVMAEIHPLPAPTHIAMALCTLIDLGFTITKPE